MTEDIDAHHEIVDAHAFAAACEAAPPGMHPDQVRRIVDAYTDAAHVKIREIHDDTPLTDEEKLAAFAGPRDYDVEG